MRKMLPLQNPPFARGIIFVQRSKTGGVVIVGCGIGCGRNTQSVYKTKPL